jgi:hypothetical protein
VSLERFWNEVRRGVYFYPVGRTPDAPQLDQQAIEEGLRSRTDWVTPYTVSGYEESSFGFLLPAERSRLTTAVFGFQTVVKPRNPFRPEAATTAETEAGLPYLRDILLILDFVRYRDPEAFRIGKMVEAEIAPFRPEELLELRFHTVDDFHPDAGLWVWGFVSSALSLNEYGQPDTTHLERGLREVARRAAPELFADIRFREVDRCGRWVHRPWKRPVKPKVRRRTK